MQKRRAWANLPPCAFVIKWNRKVVSPIQKFIPVCKGYDLAIVTLVICIQLIEIILKCYVQYLRIPSISGLFILAAGVLLGRVVNLILITVIIASLFSWFPSRRKSQLVTLVNFLVEPLLFWGRRVVPTMSGIDFSPAIIILFLQLINYCIVLRIQVWGGGLIG